MPTELSVLGNTSGKISTTKLRKYPLAESLTTVTDDEIAGLSIDHRILAIYRDKSKFQAQTNPKLSL